MREGESQGEPLVKHLFVQGPEAEPVGVALEGDHHEPPRHVHGHHLAKRGRGAIVGMGHGGRQRRGEAAAAAAARGRCVVPYLAAPLLFHGPRARLHKVVCASRRASGKKRE